MKTYSVLFAEDVPHYGVARIEAEDDAAALVAAKAYDLSEVTNDPERENSFCRRIVHIECPDGKTIHHDVALDNCFVRYGGDEERLLCDAAPDMFRAIEMVLAASEDCGDMSDIDWNQLREALSNAKGDRS